MKDQRVARKPVAGKIRILVVEDHPFTRLGMCQYLGAQSDMEICGQASEPREAMELLSKVPCDVLLCDLSLPGKGGLELIKDVRVLHPAISVLVVSVHDEPQFAPRALRAGAMGYLMKNEGMDLVANGIREIERGRMVVSERMSAVILEVFAGKRTADTGLPEGRLSDRELEVLSLIGVALGTRTIAQRLCISMKTVEAHRANIRQKLGIRSSQELMRYAICWVEDQGARGPASTSG